MNLTLYAFKYNGCVYESTWCTISIHLTRKGAKKALHDHMYEEFKSYKKYKKYCKESDLPTPRFGWAEDWCITEVDVLE